MTIELSTPALLFSMISLLLLAYTNRFIALATLIRNLHGKYKANPDQEIIAQINNLRKRVLLIRDMQLIGLTSLLLCVLAMILIYTENHLLANYLFGGSLVLLVISLTMSGWEILISTKALNIQLSDIEDKIKK